MDVKEAGRKGGLTTLKRRGPEYFKELSRKGVEARKRNTPKTQIATV